MCVFLGALLRESSVHLVLGCCAHPGCPGAHVCVFAAQRCLGKEGQGRLGCPHCVGAWGHAGVLAERAVTQVQEGTLRKALVIPGPLQHQLPFGPAQRKLGYFPGGICESPGEMESLMRLECCLTPRRTSQRVWDPGSWASPGASTVHQHPASPWLCSLG